MAKEPPHHAKGHKVRFKNPTTGKSVEGEIMEEIRVPISDGSDGQKDGWRRAAFYAQLVKWGQGYERIRFCYYVQKENPDTNWKFSRYAPSMSRNECQELIAEIIKQGWTCKQE